MNEQIENLLEIDEEEISFTYDREGKLDFADEAPRGLLLDIAG